MDPGDRREDLDQIRHYELPAALYFRDAADRNTRLFRPTWALNWLARKARNASFFWALNDDVQIAGNGWDAKILGLERHELGLTDFTPESGWHSNFPVFTRAHLEEFATLFHPSHWGWGADHWICRTYALAHSARWLQIELHHHQADAERQRRIQAHQPPPPDLSVQIAWAHRIQSLAL